MHPPPRIPPPRVPASPPLAADAHRLSTRSFPPCSRDTRSSTLAHDETSPLAPSFPPRSECSRRACAARGRRGLRVWRDAFGGDGGGGGGAAGAHGFARG